MKAQEGEPTEPDKSKHTGRPPRTEKFTKQQIKDASLEAIKKNRLFIVDDIFAYVQFSRSSFYKKRLNTDADIIKQIENNKTITRAGMRKKWYDNFNPTTQIALYRLICTKEEREALAYNKHEVTGADGAPLIPKVDEIDISKLTEEEKAVLLKLARTSGDGKQ